jgi:hypothetical protein
MRQLSPHEAVRAGKRERGGFGRSFLLPSVTVLK